jgi:hypothetical protein
MPGLFIEVMVVNYFLKKKTYFSSSALQVLYFCISKKWIDRGSQGDDAHCGRLSDH